MRRYKTIAIVWGCLCVAGLGASCTGAFDEINTNPNTVPYEMMLRDNLITGSAIGQMENYCVTTDANQYQRMFNLAGDIYAGYFGGTNTWENNYNGIQYVLLPNWYNVAFEVGYERIMAAWRVVDLVKDEEPQAYALAQILKVFGMHKITDMYGPIPYSQFGKAEIVPYDSQEAIYDSFLTELTDAIDVLTEFVQLYPGAAPLKNYDAIYQGDYSKWIKFANTLKLRLAMRIAYADEAKAKQNAEEAANHPAGLLSDNADNAFYPVPQRNPLNEIWDAYQDTRMGGTIACYLNGFGDPRREVYFSLPAGTTTWNGVRSGTTYSTTNLNNYRNRAALPKVGPNDPLQWMVAAESHFLKAEGALRGWNMGGGVPKDFYEQGIRTSFDQHGLSANYATYVANTTATPSNLSPAIVSADAYTYSPANTITIGWVESDDPERKLERIITQKYVAIFPDGQESWSEFRRTGYPKVIPVRFNRSPTNTISTTEQIRRLVFPTTEYDKNTAEVQKAVDMIGGVDHGGIKLWWDKKN
ncbi:MAG: SusD/RagB family nutrient-binding outer membrane lipoprotein [Prevotellaceae bacterium]|nr:SusD/RagB family nutrient-binding outer membrane lipoprotein [Prevotellaceae bacterium]